MSRNFSSKSAPRRRYGGRAVGDDVADNSIYVDKGGPSGRRITFSHGRGGKAVKLPPRVEDVNVFVTYRRVDWFSMSGAKKRKIMKARDMAKARGISIPPLLEPASTDRLFGPNALKTSRPAPRRSHEPSRERKRSANDNRDRRADPSPQETTPKKPRTEATQVDTSDLMEFIRNNLSGIRVVVQHVDHPDVKLTSKQSAEIEDYLYDRILAESYRTMPRFVRFCFESGCINIICHDEYSRDWLEDVLEEQDKVTVQVVPGSEPTDPHRIFFWAPGGDYLTSDGVINIIKKQNPSLDCVDWVHLKSEDDTEGQTHFYMVSEVTIRKLEQLNFRIHFGARQITINQSVVNEKDEQPADASSSDDKNESVRDADTDE